MNSADDTAPARELAALRRSFAARSHTNVDPDRCPPAATIHAAVRGSLPRAERLQLVDHLADCAACAEAWRLARAFDEELGVRLVDDELHIDAVTAHARSRSSYAALATAAGLLLALGLVYPRLPAIEGADAPVYRADAELPASTSRTVDELTRENAVLQWSAGPAGATYAVRVTGADLEPLFVADHLLLPQVRIPAAALQSVPSGATLFWQVELRLADDRSVLSRTFVLRLR